MRYRSRAQSIASSRNTPSSIKRSRPVKSSNRQIRTSRWLRSDSSNPLRGQTAHGGAVSSSLHISVSSWQHQPTSTGVSSVILWASLLPLKKSFPVCDLIQNSSFPALLQLIRCIYSIKSNQLVERVLASLHRLNEHSPRKTKYPSH